MGERLGTNRLDLLTHALAEGDAVMGPYVAIQPGEVFPEHATLDIHGKPFVMASVARVVRSGAEIQTTIRPTEDHLPAPIEIPKPSGSV